MPSSLLSVCTFGPEKWPIFRQMATSWKKGGCGGFRFSRGTLNTSCDICVVFEKVESPIQINTVSGGCILITAEPPSVKTYNHQFLSQFDHVVTCHSRMKHRSICFEQQALPWHAGVRYLDGQIISRFDWDDFQTMSPPPKSKLISVIASNKDFTRGHKRRLSFLNTLKVKLGDQLEVFGRGIRAIEDKWEALAPYRYHLVIENAVCHDYWTEKLSDAFLGWCFPIYFGCPNLQKYFPSGSYRELDISNVHYASDQISKIISSDIDAVSSNALETARNLCLRKYNFFPWISSQIEVLLSNGKIELKNRISRTLKPEKLSLRSRAIQRFRANFNSW